MSNDNKTMIGCIIIILVVIGIALCQPAFEARTYNKFKGKDQPNATYLDALVSRLRITTK